MSDYDEEEEYTYDSGGDEDYEYEDEEVFVPSKLGGKVHEETLLRGNPTLMRETSAGDYYLKIPSDSYLIQNGDEASILPLLKGALKEVSDLCGVSEDEALALSIISTFNTERVISRYMDDAERFRAEAGIDLYDRELIERQLSSPADLNRPEPVSTEPADGSTPMCEICFDTIDTPTQGFQLGCHHLYCRDCYGGHIQAKIHDGPVCISMTCPAPKCKQWIPYAAIKCMVSSELDLVSRYEKFLVSGFVEKTQSFRYCPGVNCGRVAVGSGISKIHCICGLDYCFLCGEQAHDPCSCDQLRRWTRKGNDENENLTWILANTQRCPNPKCDYPIEKNQGCNHMTCSRCRHEFCWICLRDWRDHGGSFYDCNKFKEDGSLSSERATAKRESNRYLHYFKRYQIHQDHGQHAQKMLVKYTEDLNRQIQATPGIAIDDSDRFLIDTCQQLIDWRRLLMNTYIMGYYLKDDSPDKTLFEHQQALLEEGTDLLQELVKSSAARRKKEEIIRRAQVVAGVFKRMISSFSGGIVHSFDLAL